MTNFIKWNGLSEDGSDGKKKWKNADFTWGDFQLAEELAGLGGSTPKKRREKLDKFLKDPEKKKKVIHLICRVKGEKVYDEKKELIEDIDVKVEDVDMVIEEILGKIKVETKDVL